MPDEPPHDDLASEVRDRARSYFDEFACEYDDAVAESGWVPNELLTEALEEVGPVHAAVDVACGTGATLAVVGRAFPEAALTGVDISERMLERARTRVPGAAYVHADVATFAGAAVGDPGARFDLVTSVGGLEFTADLPIVLARLGRLVRPGGHLIATYEPVIAGWPPQDARVETNLASNGGPLTTVRWEPGEIGSVFAGDPGWTEVRSALVAAYLRDGVPVVYGWLHVRRPD